MRKPIRWHYVRADATDDGDRRTFPIAERGRRTEWKQARHSLRIRWIYCYYSPSCGIRGGGIQMRLPISAVFHPADWECRWLRNWSDISDLGTCHRHFSQICLSSIGMDRTRGTTSRIISVKPTKSGTRPSSSALAKFHFGQVFQWIQVDQSSLKLNKSW